MLADSTGVLSAPQTAPQALASQTAAPISTEVLSPDQRRSVLLEEIQRQTVSGWTLTQQTDVSAAFTRKGSASCAITLILLLFAILPGVLYAILARPTETLFVQVDPYGKITRTVGQQS